VRLEDAEQRPFSYPDPGLTGRPGLPSGYHRLEVQRQVGVGEVGFARATEALFSWEMHRGIGARVEASAPEAAVGVTMVSALGVGPLRLPAPCRVVWAVREPTEAGFAYGTLAGHPVSGEERFVVTLDADVVLLRVSAVSRAGTWVTRLGGPVPRVVQRVMARRYAAALARLVAR
jgi:uncharacterized protein (UPF0548 family)